MAWWTWGRRHVDQAGSRALRGRRGPRESAARTPASTPFSRKAQGTPTRRPWRPGRARAAKSGTGSQGAGGVAGRRRRQSTAAASADVLDRAGEGADLIEGGGEGDEAVAADAPVGGLQAHDAAERRRLADRAAGVGAEGEGRHARRHGRGRAAGGAARDTRPRSQGLRVFLYALFSVDEPMANSSMFVLPRTTAPAASSRGDGGGGEGGAIAFEDARAAGRRDALDVEHVFHRDGTPARGRVGPPRRGRVDATRAVQGPLAGGRGGRRRSRARRRRCGPGAPA